MLRRQGIRNIIDLSRFLNFVYYLCLGLGHAATRKSVRIFICHKNTTAFENLVAWLVPSTQSRFFYYWSICVQIILIDVKLPPLLWPHWNIFQSSLSKQLAAMILSDTWNTLDGVEQKLKLNLLPLYYCCHPVGRSYTIPYLMVMRCFKVTQHIYLQREGSKIREEDCA